QRLRAEDGSLDAVGVRALPPSLRRRVLARLLQARGLPLDAALLERAVEALERGGVATLPQGLLLRAAGGRVRCSAARHAAATPPTARALRAGEQLWQPETGWQVGEGSAPPGALRLPLGEDTAWPLTVRTRLPGDRVRRAAGSRKLQDLLVDARIPAERRDSLPVITDAQGALLWVPGVWSARTSAQDGAPGGLLWARAPTGAQGAAPL
ncbi:MAG TPA: tRNA lysidine(34) synthetase TilS, partial [Aggregicoccus sp.]|nr:tRNA lysidine(34) synthetase TilS [Aggregicoccus sp.]